MYLLVSLSRLFNSGFCAASAGHAVQRARRGADGLGARVRHPGQPEPEGLLLRLVEQGQGLQLDRRARRHQQHYRKMEVPPIDLILVR